MPSTIILEIDGYKEDIPLVLQAAYKIVSMGFMVAWIFNNSPTPFLNLSKDSTAHLLASSDTDQCSSSAPSSFLAFKNSGEINQVTFGNLKDLIVPRPLLQILSLAKFLQ